MFCYHVHSPLTKQNYYIISMERISRCRLGYPTVFKRSVIHGLSFSVLNPSILGFRANISLVHKPPAEPTEQPIFWCRVASRGFWFYLLRVLSVHAWENLSCFTTEPCILSRNFELEILKEFRSRGQTARDRIR